MGNRSHSTATVPQHRSLSLHELLALRVVQGHPAEQVFPCPVQLRLQGESPESATCCSSSSAPTTSCLLCSSWRPPIVPERPFTCRALHLAPAPPVHKAAEWQSSCPQPQVTPLVTEQHRPRKKKGLISPAFALSRQHAAQEDRGEVLIGRGCAYPLLPTHVSSRRRRNGYFLLMVLLLWFHLFSLLVLILFFFSLFSLLSHFNYPPSTLLSFFLS